MTAFLRIAAAMLLALIAARVGQLIVLSLYLPTQEFPW